MGGINDLILSKDKAQSYTISVGQDKKIVVWSNKMNEPIYTQYIDEENDEGLAIAMLELINDIYIILYISYFILYYYLNLMIFI